MSTMPLPDKCHHNRPLVPGYYYPPLHADDSEGNDPPRHDDGDDTQVCDYLSEWPKPPSWWNGTAVS